MNNVKSGCRNIIAIDPGTEKCGVAVVGIEGEVHLQEIIPVSELVPKVEELARHYGPARIVVGDRTGAGRLMGLIEIDSIWDLVVGIEAVDEHLSSQEARRRYLEDRRRKGSWVYRLMPLGMQVPDQPYDDYVAVILAERYLKAER